jgi:CRP/FNR family transcriptional regulator, nitrogen oxide reductase regulator
MAFARADALQVALKSALFTGFGEGDVRSIVDLAKHRRYAARQVLFHSDDVAEFLFLVLCGQARHYRVTSGGKRLLVRWSPPGTAFGLPTLLPERAIYTINTDMMRSGELLVWDRETMLQLTRRHPMLFANAFVIAMRHLAHYTSIHLGLTSLTAEQRLAKSLLEFAASVNRDCLEEAEFALQNTHLADMSNVNLHTASRVLSAWQRKGWIQKSRGKIVLRSHVQLRALL